MAATIGKRSNRICASMRMSKKLTAQAEAALHVTLQDDSRAGNRPGALYGHAANPI